MPLLPLILIPGFIAAFATFEGHIGARLRKGRMGFLFPFELGRMQHLVRLVILLLAGVFTFEVVSAVSDSDLPFIVWFSAYSAYIIVYLYIPRIRNVGESPWLLLLFMVPIANFWIGYVLLCVPASTVSKKQPKTRRVL